MDADFSGTWPQLESNLTLDQQNNDSSFGWAYTLPVSQNTKKRDLNFGVTNNADWVKSFVHLRNHINVAPLLKAFMLNYEIVQFSPFLVAKQLELIGLLGKRNINFCNAKTYVSTYSSFGIASVASTHFFDNSVSVPRTD